MFEKMAGGDNLLLSLPYEEKDPVSFFAFFKLKSSCFYFVFSCHETSLRTRSRWTQAIGGEHRILTRPVLSAGYLNPVLANSQVFQASRLRAMLIPKSLLSSPQSL